MIYTGGYIDGKVQTCRLTVRQPDEVNATSLN